MTATETDREEMAAGGRRLVLEVCDLNGLRPPVLAGPVPRRYSTGLYDPRGCRLYVTHGDCARRGYGGRAWSWPGYVIDRTPYGVYPHELGHHVDYLLGGSRGVAAVARRESGEPPVSGYCPNSAEWFAEVFRVFCTNPDLLRLVRPRAYAWLSARLYPAERRPWDVVLAGAPARTLAMACRKMAGGA